MASTESVAGAPVMTGGLEGGTRISGGPVNPSITVALEAGYNSHEAFSRACNDGIGHDGEDDGHFANLLHRDLQWRCHAFTEHTGGLQDFPRRRTECVRPGGNQPTEIDALGQ